MMNTKRSIISGIDWWTILLVMVITIFGWMNIYGASFNFEQTSMFDFSNRAGKQFTWMIVAFLMGTFILFVDEKIYDTLAYFLYGGMLLLLLITPLLASNIKGSYSWIHLGPINLQPAEFAKCFTALAIAKYMGRYEYRLKDWHDLIVPLALIGVPMLIIMVAQRETGSALVFMAFMLVFYREGMSGLVLIFGVICLGLFLLVIRLGSVALPLGIGSVGMLLCILIINLLVVIYLLFIDKKTIQAILTAGITVAAYGLGLIGCIWWKVNFDYIGIACVIGIVIMLTIYAIVQRYATWAVLAVVSITLLGICVGSDYAFQHILQPHQRSRIEVLLGMTKDYTGAGYNVHQSMIAIGSGQFSGKGYLQGTQTKLKFVPEQDTDFIFCTVGEEWGFLGSSCLLLLYLALIWRIIYIAERQRDRFSRIYAYSVACIILVHVTINIGMVLGLLPVIGIPLPLFSYGGSAMIGFSLLLAILLRIDASRVNKLQ